MFQFGESTGLLPKLNDMEERQQKIYYLKENTNIEINPGTRISQYMRLDYFLEMLDTKSYYVSRKNTFLDIRETQLPIKAFFALYPIGGDCPCVMSEDAKEKKRKEKEQLFADYKEAKDWLTSCWTLYDNEDYFMWEVYAKKYGVRIQTTIDKLVQALNTEEYEIYCGAMSYYGYVGNKDLRDAAFSKDPFYANEKEFRFYYLRDEEKIKEGEEKGRKFKLKTPPNKMIDRVSLSPYIFSAARKELSDMLQKKWKFSNTQIQMSKIMIKEN